MHHNDVPLTTNVTLFTIEALPLKQSNNAFRRSVDSRAFFILFYSAFQNSRTTEKQPEEYSAKLVPVAGPEEWRV